MDKDIRKIEVLSPAANLEVGMAAIQAGADSVYIGGPAFGARAKAGNSMQDIGHLARYSHRFGAKCYMTLNTLIWDNEMPQALDLARQAYEEGVDALIIQDLGLIEAGLPPIDIHASTQCHISTLEKARFLESLGFSRLVLARELSLEEIERISSSVSCSVETFVHGALCVSYSGQCYMSCYMNGRSGNRGDCSQSCRLPYNLENARGEILQKDRYLLSMKDFKAASVASLIDAGVSCLKIEGRLKDAAYVKNVTAYYRKEVDRVLQGRSDIQAASQGKVYMDFQPDLDKTFHREYTSFFLDGNRRDWAVFSTPKATGASLGKISEVLAFKPSRYSGLELKIEKVHPSVKIVPGDGLCYISRSGVLHGSLVEKAQDLTGGRWRVWMQAPDTDSRLPQVGTQIFRNQDTAFAKKLKDAHAQRKIGVEIIWDASVFQIRMRDRITGLEVGASPVKEQCQLARDPGKARDNFEKQMMKMGEASYEVLEFRYPYGNGLPFLPMAALNQLRRDLADKMDRLLERHFHPMACHRGEIDWNEVACRWQSVIHVSGVYPDELGYLLNIANSHARKLYRRCGVECVTPAYELEKMSHPASGSSQSGSGSSHPELLMTCKHCIRFQLGQCLKKDSVDAAYAGDLFLTYGGHKFALRFNCHQCQMQVWSV